MDFVVGLQTLWQGKDSFLTITDSMTKSAHFFPIRTTDPVEKLCRKYIDEIFWLDGIPVSVVSNRDSCLISHYWSDLQDAFGAQFLLSTAFHPQMDGQTKQTIQTLEEMLRSRVFYFGGS